MILCCAVNGQSYWCVTLKIFHAANQSNHTDGRVKSEDFVKGKTSHKLPAETTKSTVRLETPKKSKSIVCSY